MRRFAFCVVLGIATLAIADVIVTNKVQGEGRAMNTEGLVGEFHMGAFQTTHGHHGGLRGQVRFADGSVRILLPAVQRMDVRENTAEMGGTGVLRFNGHEFRGQVDVVAVSNRHAHEEGDPDTLAVHFLPAVQSDPQYHFAGHVTSRDIAISTTHAY